MAGIPWPYDNPDAWNELELGGRKWPGIARVKVKGGQDLDKKRPHGQHGATLTFQGQKPKEVTITVRAWLPEQWVELQAAVAEVEPIGGKKDEQPRVINHPVTNARKVSSVAIEVIEGPEWDGGFMTYTLQCVQWFPPPKSTKGTGTAKAAKAQNPPQYAHQSTNDDEPGTLYRQKRPSKTNANP